MFFTPALQLPVLIAIALLIFTVISRHLGRFSLGTHTYPVWGFLFVTSLVYCLAMKYLDITGLSAILFLILFSHLLKTGKSKLIRTFAGTMALLLFLALGFKVVPGFENQMLVENQILKSDSKPFYASFNFDKTLAGMVFYLVLVPVTSFRIGKEKLIKSIFLTFILTAIILGCAALYGTIEPNMNN